MTSKSPARVCEDVDEQALSYAEIKALCAGNPLIKEKIDLEAEVGKLKMLKTEHRNTHYRLEDVLYTQIPNRIKALDQTAQNLRDDIETLSKNTVKGETGISPMEINGVTYTHREEAGQAILDARQSLDSAVCDKAKIGTYRGMDLYISFDVNKREWTATMATLRSKGSYSVSLGADAAGNITRIDNKLNNLHEELSVTQARLAAYVKEMEQIKTELQKPFEHEDLLNQKSERLNEVEVLLTKTEDEDVIEPPPFEDINKIVDAQMAQWAETEKTGGEKAGLGNTINQDAKR